MYLSACDYDEVMSKNSYTTTNRQPDTHKNTSQHSPPSASTSSKTSQFSFTSSSSSSASSKTRRPDPEQFRSIFAAQKKKYKPVAQKVRPIPTTLPNHFRIERKITGDPLADMPTSIQPSTFQTDRSLHTRTSREHLIASTPMASILCRTESYVRFHV